MASRIEELVASSLEVTADGAESGERRTALLALARSLQSIGLAAALHAIADAGLGVLDMAGESPAADGCRDARGADTDSPFAVTAAEAAKLRGLAEVLERAADSLSV